MKRILGVIAIAALVLLVAGVFIFIDWYQRPLGPALQLEVPTQIQSAPPAAEKPVRQVETCGDAGIMQLMVHGRASEIDDGHFGADSVRLVVVNYSEPAAAILSIPVEVWLDTPVLKELGIDQTTLSQVYQKVWENAQGETGEARTQKATQAVAQTIVDNFEFVPHHYATIEQKAFIEFVDQIGGLEVDLPAAVDGTPEGYGTYPAGLQRLDGLRTLNLARLLVPMGFSGPDYWGRLARQDAILQGMRDTILDPTNILKIPDLVNAIDQAVTTDLSVDQLINLSCMVKGVGHEVNLLTVTQDLVKFDELGRMIPNIEAIKALIAEMGGKN